MRALRRGRHASITWGLVVCGVAWGLVNFGFVLWLPVNLAQLGVDAEGVNRVLAQSALLALPGNEVVVWMYHRVSSVRTLVLLIALTTVSPLALFALGGAGRRSGGAQIA